MRPAAFIALVCVMSGCASLSKDGAQNISTDSRDFVSIEEVDPTIVVEARYFGTHNFVGRRIAGYLAPKCLLTKEAAAALAVVQADLKPFGLSLKVYDCYRPQTAVNDFSTWANDPNDTKMKAEFYPQAEKSQLFKLGYLASRSGHSRGSTVDLTIVSVPPSIENFKDGDPLVSCIEPAGVRAKDNSLDMGTGYDCFDPLANTVNPLVGKPASIHRALLKTAMERRGFKNYGQEWWHYTLVNEPYTDTYFDFPVQ